MSSLTLRIPTTLDRELRNFAHDNEMSLSKFVRITLEEKIADMKEDKEEKEMVEALKHLSCDAEIKIHSQNIMDELSGADEDISLSQLDEDSTWWRLP